MQTMQEMMNQKKTKTTNLYIVRCIKRISIDQCRKTKTKVITLANHKEHRQSHEPIETADAESGKTCAKEMRLVSFVCV